MRRVVRRAALAIATMVVSLAPACTSESSPWVRPRRLPDPGPSVMDSLARESLRVEYGGCASLLLDEGGELVCVYEPGATLRLWVMHDPQHPPKFEVQGGGAWSMGEPYVLPEELGQGYRLRLDEAGLGAVTVVVPGRPKWRLALRAREGLSAKRRASMEEKQRRSSALERQLAQPDLSVLPRLRTFTETMIADGELGMAVDTACAAAYHLTWKIGRPQLAQEIIDGVIDGIGRRIPSFERAAPLEHAALTTYRGHALRRRGQLAKAAAAYRQATRLYRRVDSTPDVLDSMPPYALVLAELGYFEAAAYWSAEARDLAIEHAQPYTLGQILTMVARVSLRLREAHRMHDDPSPGLDEVRRIYGPGGPREAYAEPFEALLSRAEFHLLDGNPTLALQEIESYRNGSLPTEQLAHIEELWLRGLLHQRADSAVVAASLRRLQQLVEFAVGPELRWKATLLEARVQELRGNEQEALGAYMRAEDLLDRLIPLAALGLPGDFAAVRHNDGTTRLVSLLAKNNDVEQAICAIRRSRARVSQLALLGHHLQNSAHDALNSLAEQYATAVRTYEDLQGRSETMATPEYEQARLTVLQRRQALEEQTLAALSSQSPLRAHLGCSDLSARSNGELLLLLFPNGADLLIFSEDEMGPTQHPTLAGYFDETPRANQWLSDLILHPLQAHLERARSIRVLATGRARNIPIHALPWSTDSHAPDLERPPLIASVPVVYGLDLPQLTSPRLDRARGHRALVLADDRADGTKWESDGVASTLTEHGWSVSRWANHELTPDRLGDALTTVNLFHYSGHAYYEDVGTYGSRRYDSTDDRLRRWPPYAGGAASEPSHISLGPHERLTVSNILMLPHAPETVVLMGCTTGVHDDRIGHGGFSLATAFLSAGSRTVIASTQEVDGQQAATLGRLLYAGMSDDSKVSSWMAYAVRLLEKQGDRPSVEPYRVYVR